MLQIAFEKDPKGFLARHRAYLEQHEAEHNLILSLCQAAENKRARGEPYDIQFSTLSSDDGLVMTAVQTPPHNLVLSRATAPEAEKLAELLVRQGFRFPGIVGPSDVAASFADAWSALTNRKSIDYMDQIVYSLTKVLFPPPVAGAMRLGKPAEAETVAQWILGFSADALPKSEQVSPADALKRAHEAIAAERLFVWDVDGRPVAQAAVSGTSTAARISMVYAPAAERGQGYAKAIVAHLSQKQLDSGRKMCCLYADARNPVSNSIYRKVGYEFVGRSSLYILEKQ